MSAITSHVLDTSRGCPAAGVLAVLEIREDGGFREIGRGATDADGRLKKLLPSGEALVRGIYRISFLTGEYFAQASVASFYPMVSVMFEVHDPAQHYHVPLLLSPFGYSTYRGS